MEPKAALKIWAESCANAGICWSLYKETLLCASGYRSFPESLTLLLQNTGLQYSAIRISGTAMTGKTGIKRSSRTVITGSPKLSETCSVIVK